MIDLHRKLRVFHEVINLRIALDPYNLRVVAPSTCIDGPLFAIMRPDVNDTL
jgi:hypothetical protein